MKLTPCICERPFELLLVKYKEGQSRYFVKCVNCERVPPWPGSETKDGAVEQWNIFMRPQWLLPNIFASRE